MQAASNDRIWLLSGDLGFSVLEPFIEKFPERFSNVGVAEQNMAGVAAGLAMSGNQVFIYSIANFAVMRCLEQIRNDICYHNANVVVVSVGGGFCYGSQGYTHHGLEDLGVMRSMSNMTVIAPADPFETRLLTRQLIGRPGPAYLRLGKSGEPILVDDPKNIAEIGQIRAIREGTDVMVLGIGSMVGNCLEAAKKLEAHDISVAVASVHSLAPLDIDFIKRAIAQFRLVVTCEEHVSCGGLGEMVASVLASQPSNVKSFCALNVNAAVTLGTIGSQSYLQKKQGLDAESIAETIHRKLKLIGC